MAKLYQESAEENKQLAQQGIEEYAKLLSLGDSQ